MIAPQELPRSDVCDLKIGEPFDRAGPYRLAQLQSLLDLFGEEQTPAELSEHRWPIGVMLISVLLVSAALWGGIIWAARAILL